MKIIYLNLIFIFFKNIIYFNIIFSLNLLLLIYNYKITFINFQYFIIVILIFIIFIITYFKNFLNYYKNLLLGFKLIILTLIINILFIFSKNLIFIFIFFEFSIFPIFFFIIFFRISERKFISSFFLLIYTSLFSLIFLFLLIYENILLKFKLVLFYFIFISSFIKFFSFIIIIIFLVKVPIFLFHIWLPKAHVESSTIGSIILARLLLKLGGIGLILIINNIISIFIKNFFFSFLLISSIYILILCFFLNDIKLIIAYFSISHIGLVLISFFLINYSRNNSITIIIISHSISSPLIFLFISILYLDFSSRIINKIRRIFFKNKIFI